MKSISLSKGSILAVDVNGNYWYTPDYKNTAWEQLVGSGGVSVSHRMTSTSNPSTSSTSKPSAPSTSNRSAPSTPSVPISVTPSNVCIGSCNATINNTNNTCKIVTQNDGNLVLYNSNGSSVWASGTNGKGKGPYTTNMQSDGNYVLYDSNNSAIWSSNTQGKGKGPYSLVMQDDCNLVIYDSTNSSLWATNSNK
jgi:hypothetical protein